MDVVQNDVIDVFKKNLLTGVLLTKCVNKNFAKFTGKHLCWSLWEVFPELLKIKPVYFCSRPTSMLQINRGTVVQLIVGVPLVIVNSVSGWIAI